MGRESSMVRGVCEVCVAAGLVPRSSWGCGWLASGMDAKLGGKGREGESGEEPLRELGGRSCRNCGAL